MTTTDFQSASKGEEQTIVVVFAFDVVDAHSEERFSLYRCEECGALLEGLYSPEHIAWHERLTQSGDRDR